MQIDKKAWQKSTNKTQSFLKPGLLIVLIITILLTVYLLRSPAKSLFSRASAPAYPINSTFVLFDFGKTLIEELRPLYKDMKASGITNLIYLNSGVLERVPCKTGPFVEAAYDENNYNIGFENHLTLAHEYGMTYYVGLAGFSWDCVPMWEGSPKDINSNMGRIIDFDRRLAVKVTNFVHSKGWDSSLLGFYVGEEYLLKFNPGKPDKPVVTYFRALIKEVKKVAPNKKFIISPWKEAYDDPKQLASAADNLFNIGIDVLAPQDGLGGKIKDYTINRDQFAAMSAVVKKRPGKELWSNAETFRPGYPDPSNNNYDPADINGVVLQVASAKPHVSGFTTWIFQHTLLSAPEFNNVPNWNGQYTPAKAALRLKLKNGYINYFAPSAYPDPFITYIGQYGDNLVVKGNKFGADGDAVSVLISYQEQVVTATARVIIDKSNNESILYIDTRNFPNYKASVKPIVAIKWLYSGTAPTSTPTVTLAPTQTPTPAQLPRVIESVFVYGNPPNQNLVVKGRNFGSVGQRVSLKVYGDGLTLYDGTAFVVREEPLDVLYIPLSYLSGYKDGMKLSAAFVEQSPTVTTTPPVIPTATPVPTKAPTSTPAPKPIVYSVFTYGKKPNQNLVIKGENFGTVGQVVSLEITIKISGKVWTLFKGTTIVYAERLENKEINVLYIPLSQVSGFKDGMQVKVNFLN